ncbi:sensor histidine kinase regulating citrate/malate metabolism [Kitasatospora sp. GP30]|uniref:sensor histidine kinase n=1 Tax=Kitasatospora sp. GP30 TaxID=3035084 RepID=UPI000C710E41|nr:sensor histidine kinase [Kitasatospora sp. GP30]MDH6142897.1 sensor histidine kinase regulating citrate/malate metabolism [Kitasatospora sp. GP30]
MPVRLSSAPRRVLRSLAGQLFAVQVVIVAVVVAGGALLAYLATADQARETARQQATAVARSVADAPSVRQAVLGPDPTAVLEPYAEQVRTDTGVDFVTVMDTHGIRWAHRDPAQIGKPFLGTIGPALRGQTFTETYTGTLGPSVRAVTPVLDDQGRVVALVSAGITVQEISHRLQGPLLALLGVAGGALLVGGAGTYLANARLRRHTHGMGAAELSHLYEYHQATLHSVREGLILLDPAGRVVLCNDAARDLLGCQIADAGAEFGSLGLPHSLVAAVLGPEPVHDEVHLTADRVVVVNTSAIGDQAALGTVVTLRDHTELQALVGELDTVRGFGEALGAQAHEAANRLHAVVSLVELGRHREAVEFATTELALAQRLTDQVVTAVSEPVLSAILLGKAAQAAESGVEFRLTPDSRIDDGVLPPRLPARDLVTILGNLIDNALDAAIEGAAADGAAPEVVVTARAEDGELLLRVADTGPGIAPDAVGEVFRRGWSTKQRTGRGLGLALVAQAARRNGGTVEVGRERGAVLTVRLPLRQAVVAG